MQRDGVFCRELLVDRGRRRIRRRGELWCGHSMIGGMTWGYAREASEGQNWSTAQNKFVRHCWVQYFLSVSESGLKKLPRRNLKNSPAFLRVVHKIKLDALPAALVLRGPGFVGVDHLRIHDHGGVVAFYFAGGLPEIHAHLAAALQKLRHGILEARQILKLLVQTLRNSPRRVAFKPILQVVDDT